MGDDGNIRIREAIENAKSLKKYWIERGMTETKDIKDMNPSVSIYELIERLLDEIVYRCN